MMGFGYGMGIWGWFINLIVIVGIIFLVVKLMTGTEHSKNRDKPADQIAAERYARGEISEEEYRRIKETLREQ